MENKFVKISDNIIINIDDISYIYKNIHDSNYCVYMKTHHAKISTNKKVFNMLSKFLNIIDGTKEEFLTEEDMQLED